MDVFSIPEMTLLAAANDYFVSNDIEYDPVHLYKDVSVSVKSKRPGESRSNHCVISWRSETCRWICTIKPACFQTVGIVYKLLLSFKTVRAVSCLSFCKLCRQAERILFFCPWLRAADIFVFFQPGSQWSWIGLQSDFVFSCCFESICLQKVVLSFTSAFQPCSPFCFTWAD